MHYTYCLRYVLLHEFLKKTSKLALRNLWTVQQFRAGQQPKHPFILNFISLITCIRIRQLPTVCTLSFVN